VETIV